MSNTPRTDALEKVDRDEWDKYYKEHTDDSFDEFLVYDIAREFERELAAAKADTARLDWLFQDAELNLFFADRAEIDAAMKEASK